jgi:peptide/nickel transport system ATP-binding protein/oligopeptide transport system ATP-binding protein
MPGGGAAARGEAPGTLGRLLERGSPARGRGVTAQAAQKPADGQSEPLLQVSGLRKHFPIRKGLFSRVVGHVHAVDGVSFSIDQGETLGLVGESGCGKSTAGKTVLKLIEPTMGTIKLGGRDITHLDGPEMRPLRRDMQIVFQDPYSSLNPRMSAGAIVREPLKNYGLDDGAGGGEKQVEALFARVGLRRQQMNAYPHEFSGGQRQRIGIARALAVSPSLIIVDEPVSALDVSIQAQVINLLTDLQDEYKLSYLFIAHDLAVVEHISHRIAVMYLGRIVELTDKTSLFETTLHPYTEALLSAVPVPKPNARHRKQVLLIGDVPSPINPPSGCHFHTRCPYAMARCRAEVPELREIMPGHWASCHLHDDGPMFPLSRPKLS